MRLPNVANAYKYSLALLLRSWCRLVQYNATSEGVSQTDIEEILFGKKYYGRQWRRWRDGQLTEAKEFKPVAIVAGQLGWIDSDLNTLFCNSYVRRYSEPPTDESESDADIMKICEMYQTYADKSEELRDAYNNLFWYAYGPANDDPTLARWEEIHQQVSSFIDHAFVFDEIERHLLEILEITSENKIFSDLTGNIENTLKKLRKKHPVS